MLKNYVKLSFSCLFLLLIISCEKDPTSGANVGGTSIYSFAGAPSGCSAPVVAGIYSVGMPMSAANTITFSVNVSTKGTYSLNTTSANGVWFSGSGVFSGTGNQTVVLTGNGTPSKMGSFSFVPVTNNTCNFSVSYSAGGPSAAFTYAGAPGNCTAPVVSGTYSSGISLGAANYVDLAVNVTTPGAYTINTNSANGIGFSGSGVFTATGAQVVRLIGNGTPSAQGSFEYTPSNNGCKFSITVGAPPPPASFTYDGAPGNCTGPNISGAFVAGTALKPSSTIKLGVNVIVAGTYSVTTNSDNGVSFSASGVFSGTGAQTITLTSTNTPTVSGQFFYTPSGGCKFDITYTSGPPPPANFFTCKINGVVTNFNTNLNGFSDQTASPYTFSVSGENSGGGVDNFAISLTDNANPIVNGGIYKNITATNTNKGCFITYSPVFGSLNPFFSSPLNNNSFTVTITSITATKAIGSFDGTIYDNFGMGPGSKSITAGSFSIGY